MASTTKIMTSLIVSEYIEKEGDKEITVTSEMVSVEGSALGLRAGDKITLNALMYGMLLASGNDAANTSAIGVAGSIDEFLILMNQKAKDLNLNSTNFMTPSGLDGEKHYSTARDMAVLTSYALQNELFKSIVALKDANIEYYSKEKNEKIIVKLSNHNKLLSMMEGCIGVKTGYTKKSGRCLVSAREDDESLLITVTFNAPDDWNDHIYLYNEALSRKRYYKVQNKIIKIKTADGNTKFLCPQNNQDICLFTKASVKEKIYLPRIIYNENLDDCGKILFEINGKIIETRNLKYN